VIQPAGKFKRVQLPEAAVLELMNVLDGDAPPDSNTPWPSFLDEHWPIAHVPGMWYHVLAYPFAGNATKALLRPQVDAWTPQQRNAAQVLSETLVAKCAKSGRWDLVATLLRAGVPCPDLLCEFKRICGRCHVACNAWQQDLSSARGNGKTSLLELAACQTMNTDNEEEEYSPLQKVMSAMCSSKQPLHFGGRSRGRIPPLIVAAAEAGRWSAVMNILQEAPEETNVHAGSLVQSRFFQAAPFKVKALVEERMQKDEITSAKAPSSSLKQYFMRDASGLVRHRETVPHAFTSNSNILKGQNGMSVLDSCFRLLPRSKDEELVFVMITPDELESASKLMTDLSKSILGLDLNRRECRQNDPSDEDDQHCWMAVICPIAYRKKDITGRSFLQIPENKLTTPYIMHKHLVKVKVVTPCCKAPLKNIPVYAQGQFAALTEDDGVAKFLLPVGKYAISSANSTEQRMVEIAAEDREGVEVVLQSSGELFVFLQDMTCDEIQKDGVMLCGNKANIPTDSGTFVGSVSMPECNGLFLRSDVKCSETLQQLQIMPNDGRKYKPNKDLTWFEDFKDDCEAAVLFTAMPIRLGDLRGPRPPSAKSLLPPSVAVARPPRPNESAPTTNIWQIEGNGQLRSHGLMLTTSNKPPLGNFKFASPARKRGATPEIRQVPRPAQHRPGSASPSRNLANSRPSSAGRPSSSGPRLCLRMERSASDRGSNSPYRSPKDLRLNKPMVLRLSEPVDMI
jgi:hypothetical protein